LALPRVWSQDLLAANSIFTFEKLLPMTGRVQVGRTVGIRFGFPPESGDAIPDSGDPARHGSPPTERYHNVSAASPGA